MRELTVVSAAKLLHKKRKSKKFNTIIKKKGMPSAACPFLSLLNFSIRIYDI
jgi:hypothetical protein